MAAGAALEFDAPVAVVARLAGRIWRSPACVRFFQGAVGCGRLFEFQLSSGEPDAQVGIFGIGGDRLLKSGQSGLGILFRKMANAEQAQGVGIMRIPAETLQQHFRGIGKTAVPDEQSSALEEGVVHGGQLLFLQAKIR